MPPAPKAPSCALLACSNRLSPDAGCWCNASLHRSSVRGGRACTWESGCCHRHPRLASCRASRGHGSEPQLHAAGSNLAVYSRDPRLFKGRRLPPPLEASIEAIPGAAAVARSIKHTASLPMWATNPSSVSSSMLLLRVTPCSLCTKPDVRSRSCHEDYARNSVVAFVRRGDRQPTRLLRGFEDARTWTSRLLPGVIFVLAHVYNADGDRRFSGGVNTIALVRLSADLVPSGPARPLRFAHARRREKNWVPFAEEAGLTGHASSVALLVTYSPSSLLEAALLEGVTLLEAPQLGRPASSGRSAGCSVALRSQEEGPGCSERG